MDNQDAIEQPNVSESVGEQQQQQQQPELTDVSESVGVGIMVKERETAFRKRIRMVSLINNNGV